MRLEIPCLHFELENQMKILIKTLSPASLASGKHSRPGDFLFASPSLKTGEEECVFPGESQLIASCPSPSASLSYLNADNSHVFINFTIFSITPEKTERLSQRAARRLF